MTFINHKNHIVYEKKKLYITTTHNYFDNIYEFKLFFPTDVLYINKIIIDIDQPLTLNCGYIYNNLLIEGENINNKQVFTFAPSIMEKNFRMDNKIFLKNDVIFLSVFDGNCLLLNSKYPINKTDIKYEYIFNDTRKDKSIINIKNSFPLMKFDYPLISIKADGDFILCNPLTNNLFYSINNEIKFEKEYTEFDKKKFNEMKEVLLNDNLISLINDKDKNCITNSYITWFFKNESNKENLTYCIEYYKFWHSIDGNILPYAIGSVEPPSQDIINYFEENNLL